MKNVRFILNITLILSLFINGGCTHGRMEPTVFPQKSPYADYKGIDVAIVLGGGGARGLAHAGVLEIFEENNIPIDLIVGSSAGSLIGVLYADDPDAQRLKKKLIALKKWDLLDVSWGAGMRMFWEMNGLVGGAAFRKYLKANLTATTFEELKIPFIAVATDVDKGVPVALDQGPIIPAIHASSAVPMIFNPVKWQGKTLVDGCVVSPPPGRSRPSLFPQNSDCYRCRGFS